MPNFGYEEMLGIGKPFPQTNAELDTLAEFMTDNIIDERSKIPTGYTYLAQFIDHDIALDSLSELIREIPPWNIMGKPQVSNKRTPFFDLETLYGTDEIRPELMENKSRLRIGWTITNAGNDEFPNDLPRYKDSVKAQIVDKRNDENLAVAQTHVAFIRFHNAIVKHLGGDDTKKMFQDAQRITIRHYQWIILHDFLRKILKGEVLDEVLKPDGIKFYKPMDDNVFIPLEFAAGAFRMGHSMVSNNYQWNKVFSDPDDQTFQQRAYLPDLIKFTGSLCDKGFKCMEGENQLPSIWIINWNWFYEIKNSANELPKHFNFSGKINTNIPNILGRLFPSYTSGFSRMASLPAIDLYRSRAMDLPTGQAVAEVILSDPSKVLQPAQLAPLLPVGLRAKYSKETPIWFYLLAEAQINEKGETFGEVGSRIVAETFVELLKRSPYSVLAEGFDFPNHKDFLGKDGIFGMPEMLQFVEEKDPGFLNPLGD